MFILKKFIFPSAIIVTTGCISVDYAVSLVIYFKHILRLRHTGISS